MSSVRVCAACAAAVVLTVSPAGAGSHLSTEDAARIREALHLRNILGDGIWADWAPHPAPILYKTRTEDVLIDHPAPPDGFVHTYDDALGDSVWVAAQTDSTRYGAAFPFAGHWTVVVSRPDAGEDPCRFALVVAHELFHVHQNRVRPTRIVNPFVGPHAGEHELSYPFPADDPAVNALFALEGELLFQALASDDADSLFLRRTGAALGHAAVVARSVFADSLDLVYTRWMEWNEGVARYTERELSRRAAAVTYTPSTAFTRAFPEASYADAWAYWRDQIAPIRFAGEGVRGRPVFYYLGMGKACLLDHLSPGWRARYFEEDLETLVAEGSAFATACAP